MENECWLPIAGFDGFYEVSDHGRVRSLDRTYVISHLKQGPVSAVRRGRILRPCVVQGYLQVALHLKGVREQRKVHQLVLETFVGPRPDGHEARHLDGVRACCALTNLCWGTKLENADDKRAHGTMCHGEVHGRAKISEEDVIAIRAARGKVRQVDLAAHYGVHQTNISAIQRGELWKHVS